MFAPPDQLPTDDWRSLLKTLRVKHFSVACHPLSKGGVERSNRAILPRSAGNQPKYLLTGRVAIFAKGLTNEQRAGEGLMMQ